MFRLTFSFFIQLLVMSGSFYFASLSAAIFYTIDTTSPLLCTFSSKFQNRVMLEQGKIQKIIAADEGRLSIFMEELSGQAFICARDQNPEDTTLSVVTETGLVQDLQITFIDRLSEIVILTDPALEEEKGENQEEPQEKVAESSVLDKIGEILVGNTPQGYAPGEIQCKQWKPKKNIILEPISQLEGPDEVLYLYQVRNTSCRRNSLSECELQCQGCRWIFLEAHTLLPKERLLCIIAVARDDR